MTAGTMRTTTTRTAEPHHSSIADDSPHWHKFVAGAAAGAGARLFTAPLDLLRIRRQVYPNTTQGNMFSSLYNIAKSEGGIHSLFRGNVAATYLWMGYAAVQFSLYDYSSHFLTSFTTLPSSAVAFLSGGFAGAGATVATYPLDICRTSFAAQGLIHTKASPDWTPPKSIWEFAFNMYRKDGLRGFFAGCGPAVVQIVPYMGLNFYLYEFLVSQESCTVGLSGMAGVASGGISKILIYPSDVVKRRMQLQAIADTHQYKNMVDCLFQIARQEGVRALYNGLVPSLVKNMIGTGLSFAIFTMVKNALSTVHLKNNPPPKPSKPTKEQSAVERERRQQLRRRVTELTSE